MVEEIQRVQNEGVRIDGRSQQADLTRILIPACRKAGIDPARLCASFADTGDSRADIPLLLDRLVRSSEASVAIRPDDRIGAKLADRFRQPSSSTSCSRPSANDE